MFTTAIAFNQYIGEWDVSNVTFMGRMFNMATAFNKPLDGWYWVKSSVDKTDWGAMNKLIPEESTVKCAPGKSYSASRPDDCSLCVVGQFQPDTVRNPENDVDCKECPAGEHQPNEGQTACEPCPKGKYCANGIAQPCPAGEYQPLEGQTSVSSCKKCEIDHTSVQGSVVCERCTVGKRTWFGDNECRDYDTPDALAQREEELAQREEELAQTLHTAYEARRTYLSLECKQSE